MPESEAPVADRPEPGASRVDGHPRVPSPMLFKLFSSYAGKYLRRHFHGVRLSGAEPAAPDGGGPLIIYLNHPSWWDPLICLFLAARFFPNRSHYGPMDARALKKYSFFRRLGFFGVEPDTQRGAAEFLRASVAVLSQPNGVLWVTGQGEFRDTRDRPLRLKSGVAHLVRRMESVRVLPLAVEYPFWQERTPEALVRFGEPIDTAVDPARPLGEWQTVLEGRLERTMDALAADAVRQDPAAFQSLVSGRAGVGGVYDVWRRAGAWVRGKRFVPGHELR